MIRQHFEILGSVRVKTPLIADHMGKNKGQVNPHQFSIFLNINSGVWEYSELSTCRPQAPKPVPSHPSSIHPRQATFGDSGPNHDQARSDCTTHQCCERKLETGHRVASISNASCRAPSSLHRTRVRSPPCTSIL
ncbi:hypothetical protein CIHG_07963 [Coccidioides immitis H538.4]|uniref:Uncharacterized protein n=1 Tax=Coccidioides immitis H538.4 TaxID=396776 RepID=A0A0J8URD3_COCIT|nr:hypothetical protein CIHG_07963 [Coccidioides immitis H538.4]